MNPKIAKVFYDMRYAEKFDSGIRMMRRECRAMNIPEPEYKIGKGRIDIVFRLPEKKDSGTALKLPADLTENEVRICEMISEHGGVTISELVTKTELTKNQVYGILTSLAKKRCHQEDRFQKERVMDS